MKLDFGAINSAALAQLPTLLESWLPGGRVEGAEYTALNPTRGDSRPGSFKVNVDSGVWSDFATEDGGSDPVSLYAYLNGLKQGEAAQRLAEALRVDSRDSTHPQPKSRKKQEEWTPVVPVPDDAPPPEYRHYKHGFPVQVWEYHNEAGGLLGAVCRFEPEGESKQILPYTFCRGPKKAEWRWKGWNVPRPLYGLDRLAASPGGKVLLVEGEKAADAAQIMAGSKLVVITWPGGSKAVDKADWTALKGRTVCVWPDNDAPGFKAALAIADKGREAGFEVSGIVQPSPEWEAGADLADFPHWTQPDLFREIRERKADITSFKDIAKARFDIETGPRQGQNRQHESFPFSIRPDGVYFLAEDKDGGMRAEWVCSPLNVIAQTRNEAGDNWGRLLELVDLDGRRKRWAMPMSMAAGNGDTYRSHLLGLGVRIASGQRGRNRFHDYITQAPTEGRALCVERTGWHSGRFVLPSLTIGPDNGEEVVYQGIPEEDLFKTSGTLDEWRDEIGRLCVGNSRFAFAVSIAFAGPLLNLVHAESGGFHFVGGSSAGKTTLAEVAGSVCGGGGLHGFLRQWRTTDNALEGQVMAHNDALLVLDEINQAAPKAIHASAYMLANGQGKGRANKSGQNRKLYQWRIVFISTGEEGLADYLLRDKIKMNAGQGVRMPDIPADAGQGMKSLEHLHHFRDGAALSEHFKTASKKLYGTPFRAYLEAVTHRKEGAASFARARMDAFKAEALSADADSQVSRVCGRFALVAAAGELATYYGILPWEPGEASRAAHKCFDAWVAQRGGVTSQELKDGLSQIRSFIQAHGASRFEDADAEHDQRIINRVGFKRKVYGQTRYHIYPDQFRREVCEGRDLTQALTYLRERGVLLPENGGRFTRSVRTSGGKSKMYVFTDAIMTIPAGDGGDTGDNADMIEKNPVPTAGDMPGTPGTNGTQEAECPHCPHLPFDAGDTKNTCYSSGVPTVPTVPTEKRQTQGETALQFSEGAAPEGEEQNTFPHEVEI